MTRVIIEGIPGAGKSSIVESVGTNGFEVVLESVDRYVDFCGYNLLQEQQKRENRMCCQTTINNIMFQNHMSVGESENVVFERGIRSLRIFYEMYRDNYTNLEQAAIVEHMGVLEKVCIPESATIYLRCHPEVALKRVKRRGRAGENNVDVAFLRRLSDIHDMFLLNKPNVYVVDANGPINRVRMEVVDILKRCV